jgi:biopolymer transport protein ExbD
MSAAPANTKALRIFIDNSARIYLDGNPVKIWMLQSRVRELLRSASDKQILVVVDKSVPADRLIEVVDQCRLAGASDVGVATEREAG